jgi:hypothetical protein
MGGVFPLGLNGLSNLVSPIVVAEVEEIDLKEKK